jgi:uridine kinase
MASFATDSIVIIYIYIQKQEIIIIEGIHIKLPNAKKVEIEYLADL